ncbi:hypothetical protein ABMH92_004800, partial [Escherichia coli]
FSQNIYDKYNFVIFEETINSASKETLRHLAEKSSCLILVLDRSMSSVQAIEYGKSQGVKVTVTQVK